MRLTDKETDMMIAKCLCSDIAVMGLRNYCKAKGFLEEADEYVKRFMASITDEQWEAIQSQYVKNLTDSVPREVA